MLLFSISIKNALIRHTFKNNWILDCGFLFNLPNHWSKSLNYRLLIEKDNVWALSREIIPLTTWTNNACRHRLGVITVCLSIDVLNFLHYCAIEDSIDINCVKIYGTTPAYRVERGTIKDNSCLKVFLSLNQKNQTHNEQPDLHSLIYKYKILQANENISHFCLEIYPNRIKISLKTK